MPTVAQVVSDVDDIPWDRIVHFYGRASGVPGAIRDLASPDDRTRRTAHGTLRNNLEHQDGVVQATAFAVPYIIRMLTVEDLPDKSVIISMLWRFLNSTRFTLEHRERLPHAVASRYCGADATYWPEFTTEEDDEIRWEESDPSPDEYSAWQQLTEQAIVDARPLISDLSRTDDAELNRQCCKLVALIDCDSWTSAT